MPTGMQTVKTRLIRTLMGPAVGSRSLGVTGGLSFEDASYPGPLSVSLCFLNSEVKNLL
jgi:hypothetical protein